MESKVKGWNPEVKDTDFAFTLCSTSLHGKTVAVRQLQKLKADATCS